MVFQARFAQLVEDASLSVGERPWDTRQGNPFPHPQCRGQLRCRGGQVAVRSCFPCLCHRLLEPIEVKSVWRNAQGVTTVDEPQGAVAVLAQRLSEPVDVSAYRSYG